MILNILVGWCIVACIVGWCWYRMKTLPGQRSPNHVPTCPQGHPQATPWTGCPGGECWYGHPINRPEKTIYRPARPLSESETRRLTELEQLIHKDEQAT